MNHWGASTARLSALLLMAVACAGRHATQEAASEPSLRSDREAYEAESTQAGPRVRIVAVYRNAMRRVVYIPRCGSEMPSFTLERFTNGVWRRGYDPVCQLIGLPALAVPPGRQATDTLDILFVTNAPYGPLPRHLLADVPGRYRIVYGVFAGAEADRHGVFDPLPLSMRTSNAFRITVSGVP